MFKDLFQKLKGLASDPAGFDPSTLGDPVAMTTEWTPLKGGGSNFCTHQLVTVNSDQVKFQATTGTILFSLVFLVSGIGVLVLFLFPQLSSGRFTLNIDTIMPTIIGLIFTTAGGFMLAFGTAPAFFDKRNGYFWKGRKNPDEVFDKSTLKDCVLLEHIHALQLVSEFCRGNKSSFYSYELNLVLQDGKRINVIDHGNQYKLQEDAKILAQFLGKPVWNAIG